MKIKIFLRMICILNIVSCLINYLTHNVDGLIMNSSFAIVMAILSLDEY